MNNLIAKPVLYSEIKIGNHVYPTLKAYEYWEIDQKGYEYTIQAIQLLLCDKTKAIKLGEYITLKRIEPSAMKILGQISDIKFANSSVTVFLINVDFF